jgi:RHS repeat-associated protein
MAYADIGQSERASAGSSSFLNGLLGMTRQTGRSTLAFTRTPGGALVSMRSGTSHFYYVFDALGSVIALTDGSGAIAASYTYDPYGTTLSASGAQAGVNPFRFASGYFDSATGLTKFGARYYDPSLGRWTQRDPIAGSIANPSAMDRYVYAGDSPVNLTDPSGALDTGALLGAVASGCVQGIGKELAVSLAVAIATGGQLELGLAPAAFGCWAGAGFEVASSSAVGNPYAIAGFFFAENLGLVFSALF